MKFPFENPDLYFYGFDLALSLCLYGFSIALFLRQKREFLTPLLFFGLFIFPFQFSQWFLSEKIALVISTPVEIFEILYQLFIKVCLILSLIFFHG